jgi:hypothetical protein
MTDREGRIREIAYFLWLEEGCPEGQADRHWETAQTVIDSEDFERKAIEGEPPGDPPISSTAGATARVFRRGGVAAGKG